MSLDDVGGITKGQKRMLGFLWGQRLYHGDAYVLTPIDANLGLPGTITGLIDQSLIEAQTCENLLKAKVWGLRITDRGGTFARLMGLDKAVKPDDV